MHILDDRRQVKVFCAVIGAATFSRMTLGIMTHGISILGKMTLGIMTFA